MAVSIDRRILELASRQDWVVTRSQLAEAGVSNASINRRTPDTLVPLAPGVFSLGSPSRAGVMRAAVLANPVGALCDATAAELLDVPCRRLEAISIVVPHGRGRDVRGGVVVRRTTHLPVDDICGGDVPRTALERTICDLAWRQDPQATRRLIEWALTNRRMSVASFRACVRSYCRRGRPGSRLLHLLDEALLADEPVPASELERRALGTLRRHGVAGWELHYRPPWSDGVVGIVDLAWPEHRLIVELDGRRWHSTAEAMERDRRRDRDANAHGWKVLRFSWEEVTERPRSFVNEIRFFLGPSFSSFSSSE